LSSSVNSDKKRLLVLIHSSNHFYHRYHFRHEVIVKDHLIKFILTKTFPCIMARMVAKKGFMHVVEIENIQGPEDSKKMLAEAYYFIDCFREDPEKLSSFIVIFKHPHYLDENVFEETFWNVLKNLHRMDKNSYPHDPRVSSNPMDDNFSYSLKSEAFFILALHPKSPRWARRFSAPAIVFNPHVQFEKLRHQGLFKRIRDIIRDRDKKLQGDVNPMLNDFGEKSEIYQYLGKAYASGDPLPSTFYKRSHLQRRDETQIV
jgi:FPC/CPF motif-containing protein YcgG